MKYSYWEIDKHYYEAWPVCHKCKGVAGMDIASAYDTHEPLLSKYCPHCGAFMVEKPAGDPPKYLNRD